MRSLTCALALGAVSALCVPGYACAQAGAAPLSASQVRELLVWNSPWEGRATPPQLYSFRAVFRIRRDAVVAETTSYATNQRATSVVTVTDGRLAWQDANGAEVDVAVAPSGELVGTAASSGQNLKVVFKPRP